MNQVEVLDHCGIQKKPRFAGMAVVGVLWFWLVLYLGNAGFFDAAEEAFPTSMIAGITVPLLVFAIDTWFLGRRIFRSLWEASPAVLTRLQVYRVAGTFFWVEWAMGRLPAGFAIPAALGDIAVGISAVFVADGLECDASACRLHAKWWNILGVADLVIAVFLGITFSHTILGVFAGPITTHSVALFPLSLIPTFLVPLSLILHGVALIRSRRSGA
jgi:hypothetical protein